MDLGLEGRVALVTGSSAGIGRASAKALARQGAQVVLAARREPALRQVAEEIVAAGGEEPTVIAADLTDPQAAELVVRTIGDTHGRLDVLANIAGGTDRPGVELTDQAWRDQFVLNFHHKRWLAEASMPLLKNSGQGRIINFVGILEPTTVNAAQAAVAACIVWSKGLSRIVAADGVTVNTLAPGRVDSEQIQLVIPEGPARQEFIDQRIPAGRFGEPEEAAAVVTFLASKAASYVTGQMLCVDGGLQWAI